MDWWVLNNLAHVFLLIKPNVAGNTLIDALGGNLFVQGQHRSGVCLSGLKPRKVLICFKLLDTNVNNHWTEHDSVRIQLLMHVQK